MTRNQAAEQPSFDDAQCASGRVTLRGPADMADALPYLLGYYPDDSLVLVGLHGTKHRVGGRVRTAIPDSPDVWRATAKQLAASLVEGSEARGGRPDAALLYLCQDPAASDQPAAVMERLRPLAQLLRRSCGELDVPVFEALCVSGGRYWSYCCPNQECCTAEGTPMPTQGASPMAAAATYAGVQLRGSLKDLERRLAPLEGPAAGRQARAFDGAAADLTPRLVGTAAQRAAVREETLRLAEGLLGRFRKGGLPPGDPVAADARDDALLTSQEAARLILGLQDRMTRDQAAEWMEGEDAHPALRLWRALGRRCVGAYTGHAAAPLTLAGWVAWSLEDPTSARVALGRALVVDAEYVYARLLHQALNDGLDAESLRRCMRSQRAARKHGLESGGQL